MPSKHGKGWRARWVDADGRRQSECFVSYKDAQACERQKKIEAQRIRHGLATAPKPDHSFDELCDAWLRDRASVKRSGKHDESIIRCHLRGAFRGRIRDVTTERAAAFRRGLHHLGEKTRENILTLLVAMLNYAHEGLDWIDDVPKIEKPNTRLYSQDFAYLRSDDEIRKFLLAAKEEEDPTVFALYATAIYTGLRAGELAGLRWAHVDFDRRLITVQHSYLGPTKAGDVRYVPIVDALLPILRNWRLACGTDLVFANQAGRMLTKSARIFQEVLKRVLDRAGFVHGIRGGRERNYIVFHDLRHTFASHWVMRGGDIFKLQKILGHKSMVMTMRYAHLAPDAYVADHARFVDHVQTSGADVIEHPRFAAGARP